jgi:hypothetical protein
MGVTARTLRRWRGGADPGPLARAFVDVLSIVATKLELSCLHECAELLPEVEDDLRDLEAEASASAHEAVAGAELLPELAKELGRGLAPQPPAEQAPRPRTYTVPTACEAPSVEQTRQVEKAPAAPRIPARATSCPYGAPLAVKRSAGRPALRPDAVLTGERDRATGELDREEGR